jgi:hypothetical protein
MDKYRVLIDACLKHEVPFFWRSRGTLLISGKGIRQVLQEVSRTHQILGLEGFDLESTTIHPRLDLIFDSSTMPTGPDASKVVSSWPEEAWVDVTLAEEPGPL